MIRAICSKFYPAILAGVIALLVLSSCTTETALRHDDDRVQVIVTTPILKDLVEQVGGERVVVSSIVPDTADPHSYEPTLRSIRNIVYADIAFSNYLMLEQHAIIKALDANLRAGVQNISLAESAVKYAAELIPLVENVNLDSVWLGMRISGGGTDMDVTRSSEVHIKATSVDGPGEVAAYLTQAFGEPHFYLDSSTIEDPSSPHNTATLPIGAHTHMGWTFNKPGVYRINFYGARTSSADQVPQVIAESTITFAVGVDPNTVPGMDVRHVVQQGHADITVDIDTNDLYIYATPNEGNEASQVRLDPETTVIHLPDHSVTDLPTHRAFRFLGKPGDDMFHLPQAVLGKHVHGDIDPHLWHDVKNAMAYVDLIADSLSEVDPLGEEYYRKSTERYLVELEELDDHVREKIQSIPPHRRKLITTHDAFGYLSAAYGIEIAGFVTPHPAAEPSLADRQQLSATVADLELPAVFLEPNLIARSSMLTEIAEHAGVEVCPIYADSFGPDVGSYVELMEFNAASLHRCLSA